MTNLRKADLSGTNLADVSLNRSEIDDTNFRGALINETVFSNLDMSKAKGLESCIHHGPSTIDYRTLQHSSLLPLQFLRGCGLSDRVIDYLPTLLNESIQFFHALSATQLKTKISPIVCTPTFKIEGSVAGSRLMIFRSAQKPGTPLTRQFGFVTKYFSSSLKTQSQVTGWKMR